MLFLSLFSSVATAVHEPSGSVKILDFVSSAPRSAVDSAVASSDTIVSTHQSALSAVVTAVDFERELVAVTAAGCSPAFVGAHRVAR